MLQQENCSIAQLKQKEQNYETVLHTRDFYINFFLHLTIYLIMFKRITSW